jgi:hypothetical protein
MEAFTRRDAAGVATLYAPGAQLLPPEAELVKGEAAIDLVERPGYREPSWTTASDGHEGLRSPM